MSLALASPVGTEVFSGPHGDADRKGSAGPLKDSKHTGGRATTGRGNTPEPDDGNTDRNDHSRLLHSEGGPGGSNVLKLAMESVA
ncbi:hypothetical protein NDU88_001370 [Pleurodeles waltl]|uniref:Uncharacterized protein n=1 Tax=Pleurodeles waltl TaxID=8319 RepID=A0AAV7MPQ7_PLEWA|nr:hypothetical protein NDU88_001370 [Pleurodeles waltl]